MKLLARLFWFTLALLFLIEAWLWRALEPVVERIVAALPFAELKRRLTAAIERLPPYATFVVFMIPGALLFPFKLAALWFIGRGQFLFGAMVFAAAKIVGTGIVAFLFHICQPKLLTIPWFARLYALVMRARDWAHALVDPYKRRIRAYWRLLRMRNPSLFARRVAWLRKRAAARAA